MVKKAMRGELLILLATLLAAVGWVASKFVILEISGELFITVRFLLAGLILLPFCYQHIHTLTLSQISFLCLVGVVFASSIGVWIHAVSISSTLSEGAFIMSLAMVIAPFISWFLFKIKPNMAFWGALPIAILGMILLTLTHSWEVEQNQWYFLLASTLLSLHFVLNKKVINTIHPLMSICVQFFIVGICGGISLIAVTPEPFELNSHVLFWFIVSTIVATALRYLAQTAGQLLVEVETASLIMILEPIWTLVLSISLLGETIKVQKAIGGGLILLSLAFYVKVSMRQKKE